MRGLENVGEFVTMEVTGEVVSEKGSEVTPAAGTSGLKKVGRNKGRRVGLPASQFFRNSTVEEF